eukprot:48154-Pelagomonas_calceolata.AAC.1
MGAPGLPKHFMNVRPVSLQLVQENCLLVLLISTSTERHNIACRIVLKLVSEGSYGANLVQLDACKTNRLAQHDLQVHKQASNRAVPSYLLKPMIPNQTRRNSSRPDAILVTPYPTDPYRSPTPPSHW